MEKNCVLCRRAILPGNLYYKWADNYICSACGGRKTMANINDALGGGFAMVDGVIESGLVDQTDSEHCYVEDTPAPASEYDESSLVNQTDSELEEYDA